MPHRIGAIKRFSRKGFVWRKNPIALRRWPVFIRSTYSGPRCPTALAQSSAFQERALFGEKIRSRCGAGQFLYDRLIADRDAPPHWRNQALFKKGLGWEKKSDRAAALASFYTIDL